MKKRVTFLTLALLTFAVLVLGYARLTAQDRTRADPPGASRLEGSRDARDDQPCEGRPRNVLFALAASPDNDGRHQDRVGENENDALERDAERHAQRARLVRFVADVLVRHGSSRRTHEGRCLQALRDNDAREAPALVRASLYSFIGACANRRNQAAAARKLA